MVLPYSFTSSRMLIRLVAIGFGIITCTNLNTELGVGAIFMG
jgi:hypothetical protein